MPDLQITRNVRIPDTLRIARSKSSPHLGPRILFFSGGSALNDIARELKHYTHNSYHLITPFDSGGSSQVLRKAFDMPAVGDLRSRLMALADETELGQPDIYRLFTYRFPKDAKPKDLYDEFETVLTGHHDLMRAISQPMRALIVNQLRVFADHCPGDFDMAGASLGNLILAGGYLANDRALEPVLFLMSKMVDVRGTVRAVVDRNFGLGAVLESGETIWGQRRLTGKEEAPITAPIQELFLTKGKTRFPRDKAVLPKRNRRLIERADLICFPPGSLYTSVIANLLPRGVGSSIAQSSAPKIYVPSLGEDPECPGMTLTDNISALLSTLRQDAGNVPVAALLSAVLIEQDSVSVSEVKQAQKDHEIPCIALPMAQKNAPNRYNPARLCDALISFI